jgi:hypothetical protein
MQILNKISMKEIFGNVRKLIIEHETVDYLLVVGVVKKKVQGSKKFGDDDEPTLSWGFEGNFKAQRLDTKEQFRSARCYLPALAADIIADQCDDSDTNMVQFAFVIGIKDKPEAATGYVYTAKSLIKPVEDESMLAIQKQVQDNVPEEEKGKYVMDEFLNTQIKPQLGHETAP